MFWFHFFKNLSELKYNTALNLNCLLKIYHALNVFLLKVLTCLPLLEVLNKKSVQNLLKKTPNTAKTHLFQKRNMLQINT